MEKNVFTFCFQDLCSLFLALVVICIAVPGGKTLVKMQIFKTRVEGKLCEYGAPKLAFLKMLLKFGGESGLFSFRSRI